MTSRTTQQLLTAGATTVAVGTLAGPSWPAYLVGLGCAVALWVMLRFADQDRDRPRVATRTYLVGSVVGVGFGLLLTAIADGESWWPVGFLLAGALAPTATRDVAPVGDGHHGR